MRVFVYPADVGGCGFYRLIWPARAVLTESPGSDIHIKIPEQEGSQIQTMQRVNDDMTIQVLAASNPGCDVVVLQRPLQRLLVDTIPMLQDMGIKVIVEIDDDFHAIDPRNVAYHKTLAKDSPNRNRDQLMKACSLADRVTVSTPQLLQRYGCGKGMILPNYVPRWYTKLPKIFNEPNRIGWSGSIDTHPNDLQQMGAAFPALVRKGHEIRVVGTALGVGRKTGLPPDYGILACGWVPLDDYPLKMSEIDVGVVPLESSLFNHAKSWLKGLEFASLGVPFVASQTRPYLELEAMGVGQTVHRPKDWQKVLLTNSEQREELGAQYRQRVIDQGLIVEERCQLWYDAWTKW